MLTLSEAAEQLGLAASTLRHQVQVGRMRARLMGNLADSTGRRNKLGELL
jgi:excisionase family DNA binding protein